MSAGGLWAELGIEPTTDERSIKRAYATRLKVDRAHLDAAGFIALRAAYEAAMQQARGGAAAPAATPRVLWPPAPGPTPPARRTRRPAPVPDPTLAPAAPPPATQPAPQRHRRDADDGSARQARTGSAPAHGIQPLLAALRAALEREVPAAELQALLARVLSHRDVQRFTSRHSVERALIDMVVGFGDRAQPLMPALLHEFDWRDDQVDLMKRFPAQAPALLAMLPRAWPFKPPQTPQPATQPDAGAAPKPTAPPASLVQWFGRRVDIWFAAAWPWRVLVLLLWRGGRPALQAQLDGLPATGAPPTALHRWWGAALRFVPPLDPGLSLLGLATAAGFAWPAAPDGAALPWARLALQIIGILAAGLFGPWLLFSLPLRLMRESQLSFGRHWPVIAGVLSAIALVHYDEAASVPALTIALGLLLVVSIGRHMSRNLGTTAWMATALVMTLVQVLELDATAPGVAGLGRAALSMIGLLILSEEALGRTPQTTVRRRHLALGLTLAALATAALPIPAPAMWMALLVSTLLAQWLGPLPTPRWLQGLAARPWLATRARDPAVVLRMAVLMGLWLICALAENDATVFRACAAMPMLRCLWLLASALPKWRQRFPVTRRA